MYYFRRQDDNHDAVPKGTNRRRKRKRSSSFPIIDAVSSETPMTETNIVINMDHAFQSTVANSSNQHVSIIIPGSIGISPAVIFRYLADKFSNENEDQNDVEHPNYFIRPKQTTVSLSNIMDFKSFQHMASPFDYSSSNSSSASEVRIWTI